MKPSGPRARVRFPDRRTILFGRQRDLNLLLEHHNESGVTCLMGPAQCGKSWLVTELARELNSRSDVHVGHTETHGDTPDAFVRAIADTYAYLVRDAKFSQQLKSLIIQNNEDLVVKSGLAFGRLVEALSILPGAVSSDKAKPLTALFSALKNQNDLLVKGPYSPKPVQYDQALALVKLCYAISPKPIVLLIDHWDFSTSPADEAKLLRSFLRNSSDWPPLHVFLAARSGSEAEYQAKKLVREFPHAHTYAVPDMHLTEDAERMLSYLRSKVKVCQTLSDPRLLQMIGGFAGVIYRWTEPYNASRIRTEADLDRLAHSAFLYKYEEFDLIVEKLDEREKRFAIRLALFSGMNHETWQDSKEALMQGFAPETIASLEEKGLFESNEQAYPSFGHNKRWQAFQDWLAAADHLITRIRLECEALIESCMSSMKAPEARHGYLAGFLVGLSGSWILDKLGMRSQLICDTQKAIVYGQYDQLDIKNLSQLIRDDRHVAVWISALVTYSALPPSVIAIKDLSILFELGLLSRLMFPRSEAIAQNFAVFLNITKPVKFERSRKELLSQIVEDFPVLEGLRAQLASLAED